MCYSQSFTFKLILFVFCQILVLTHHSFAQYSFSNRSRALAGISYSDDSLPSDVFQSTLSSYNKGFSLSTGYFRPFGIAELEQYHMAFSYGTKRQMQHLGISYMGFEGYQEYHAASSFQRRFGAVDIGFNAQWVRQSFGADLVDTRVLAAGLAHSLSDKLGLALQYWRIMPTKYADVEAIIRSNLLWSVASYLQLMAEWGMRADQRLEFKTAAVLHLTSRRFQLLFGYDSLRQSPSFGLFLQAKGLAIVIQQSFHPILGSSHGVEVIRP